VASTALCNLCPWTRAGGLSKRSGNKASAKYGAGYCDAQCPRDLKFINGDANSGQWAESFNDPNAGVRQYGSCCTVMDIWCIYIQA
jgi:cellulose 1,4-beta-cellobiosidase